MLPVWLFVFGLFIVITVRTVINLFKNKDWKPLAVQIITILLWFYFPFTQTVLDIDFKIHKSEREEVVSKVDNGTLKPKASDHTTINLPKKFKHLSKDGGEIVVETLKK